jgi:hypothetical protein
VKSLRSNPSETLFIAASILTNGAELLCNGYVVLDEPVSPEEGLTGFSGDVDDGFRRMDFPDSGVRDLL